MTAIWRIIAFGLAFGLVVTVLVLSCRPLGPGVELAGKWMGFRPYDVPKGSDEDIVRNLAKVEVRITRNGKFTLFENGLPKSGNVSYAEGKAILNITEIAGQPLRGQPEEIQSRLGPIEITAGKGKDEIVYRDPKLQEQPVILTRIATDPLNRP